MVYMYISIYNINTIFINTVFRAVLIAMQRRQVIGDWEKWERGCCSVTRSGQGRSLRRAEA